MTNFDWIAVYGAALSTLIFVREWLGSRNRLKVTVADGLDTMKHDGFCAVIRVSNHGTRPLMLFHVGMMWPYRTVTLWDHIRHVARFRRVNRRLGWVNGSLPERDGGYDFPRIVEPMHSVDFWVPLTAIEEDSDDDRNVFIGTAQDALGRNSYSEPFEMHHAPVVALDE